MFGQILIPKRVKKINPRLDERQQNQSNYNYLNIWPTLVNFPFLAGLHFLVITAISYGHVTESLPAALTCITCKDFLPWISPCSHPYPSPCHIRTPGKAWGSSVEDFTISELLEPHETKHLFPKPTRKAMMCLIPEKEHTFS